MLVVVLRFVLVVVFVDEALFVEFELAAFASASAAAAALKFAAIVLGLSFIFSRKKLIN